MAEESNDIKLEHVGFTKIGPQQLSELPICLDIDGKNFKVKNSLFEGDLLENNSNVVMMDINNLKDKMEKMYKLNLLLIYISHNSYIDVGFYIKENNLFDLLEEME